MKLIENIDKEKEEYPLLSLAIQKSRDAFFITDEESYFKYANDEACRYLGYSSEEIVGGMRVSDIDPDFLSDTWSEHWQELQSGQTHLVETKHLAKDGSWVFVEVKTNYFEYAGKGYNLAFVRDISERKQSEQVVALLSFAINQVSECFYLIDEAAQIKYVNDEACREVGYTRDELLNMSIPELDPDYQESFWRLHWQDIKKNRSVRFETKHKLKNGEIIPVEVNANYFEYDGVGYNLALSHNISERKKQEAHIQYLAFHDALTGLPNRKMVIERLEQELVSMRRHMQTLAVIFMDLDRFKTINDTLGHQTGDLLLQKVGERIQTVLRLGDTVGRLGGDEFVVLLPDLETVEGAAHVAEKLLEVIAAPFNILGRDLHISASIGISLASRDAETAETLLKYADMALYHAKENGRDTYRYFSPDLDEKVHQRLRLEHELHAALRQNQFHLVYQPLIDAARDQCIGVEVLLRWTHPQHGLISPVDFIPVAEETGVIISIGKWVLRSACMQAKVWFDAGKTDFRVAVNLSRRQLDYAGLVNDIQQILVETQCPAKMLELEVTESSTMQDPEQAIQILNKLHDLGICLALDDYGTGYSSLAYLKRFPFDRLKIDRSFVDGIPEDKDDMVIVKTTIMLAHQLNLDVIAEGVETQQQIDYLLAHGCNEMQGYLFATPMTKDDLEQQSYF